MWIDKAEIEQRALHARQEHNIQGYGVKDIFALMTQNDIDLIRYPFGKDVLLGFTTIFEGKNIVVSNSSEILSREIFTIAHELGHMIYDFKDEDINVKIDMEINENSDDISEARAFYFANCFLMPEEELTKYIKYELKKKRHDISTLDIVRIQLEFQVSYAATIVRLYEIGIINYDQKSILFNSRNTVTSKELFNKLDADKKLLRSANVIEVPAKYLEFVTSNYNKNYIPYSSLEKAFKLIGIEAKLFKKEKNNKEILEIDNIFGEFI